MLRRALCLEVCLEVELPNIYAILYTMNKPRFINDKIYHIYNRGVEKRDVFLTNRDRFRFINNLIEFNDTKPVPPSNVRYTTRHPKTVTSQCLEVQLLNIGARSAKEPLVEILAFCLMPNHYHLLVRQLTSNGVTKFMQKIGTGYTNYFNQKDKRVGSLFQGRFKAVAITNEEHFTYLPLYIHLNPLDLVAPKWREKKITNLKEALSFLENYRWSSYLDYIGKKNFPLATQKEFLLKIFGDIKTIKQNTIDFITDLNLEEIRDYTLE